MRQLTQLILSPQENPLYLNPQKLWRRLSMSFRLAFVSAFSIGLIVHGYAFSNLLLNHDGFHSIKATNMFLRSGRWSIALFSSFSGEYEMPVVIGLLTIIALALCAGLTVCILDIRSPVCILLVSGFMVSFPSIACSFLYLFAADAYYIAAFLQVAAVYVAKKFRYGYFLSILCVATSLGIYQAFIGCSVALFLFDCIFALFSDESTKSILKRGVRYIAVILAGLVLYRIILTYSLWKAHTTLLDYKNMSLALDSGLSDYLRALPLTYRQLILFFYKPSYMSSRLRLVQVIMFALAGGCFFFLTIRTRIYKDSLRLFLLICGVALLPAAINLICVICAGLAPVNMLMQYSYVFTYVFALKLLEMTAMEAQSPHHEIAKHATVLVSLVLCAALVWTNFCVTNETYLALDLSIETSQSTGIRILSRLEALEGYVPGKTPVMFVDHTFAAERTRVSFPELGQMTGIGNMSLLGHYAAPAFLKHFCGAGNILTLDTEQYDAIISSGVLDSMPVFPAKDSIQWYDGVVIVNVG